MEVGAVKQAYNNEVILLNKNLKQAKTHVIHKLTRKAKQLTAKKCPEPLKEKNKRKVESTVQEVLIIKKIKARDIAKFIVTHEGKLNDYLNKPNVDEKKACARLLLHKAMATKYELIRSRFANVSINDLLMSRQERLKLKKEEKEKQNNKRKKQKGVKTDNVSGISNVSDVSKEFMEIDSTIGHEDVDNGNEYDGDGKGSVDDGDSISEVESDSDNENDSETNNDPKEDKESLEKSKTFIKVIEDKATTDTNESSNDDLESEVLEVPNNFKSNVINTIPIKLPKENKSKTNMTVKDNNKNKNLKEKLLTRKFNKKLEENFTTTKVVDPFFVTASGDKYMSLVEPRQPDEIKEVHKEGNRQYRRAVMFGHVPKSKPRREKFNKNNETNNFNNRQNKYEKSNNVNVNNQSSSKNIDKKNSRDEKIKKDDVPEKLHPSWEAKRKQSTIVPFQGKKIMFDDS